MRNAIHCFRRESAGHWTCLEACELVLPSGRIQVAAGTTFTRGTRFMDVDIAALLELEHVSAMAGHAKS
jgi:hypothetical protein